MNPCTLQQFESRLQKGSAIEKLWDEAGPFIKAGKVESRAQAYILFSQALKISNLAKQDESLRDLWNDLLTQGSFSLCQMDSEPIQYNFHTITLLMKADKDSFEVDVLVVDPKSADLVKIAEAVHIIAESSLGGSPGASRFQSILSRPITLCLLAHEREAFIACVYGSYLELPHVHFFHINFLGRRIEYPSVHIIEKVQLIEKLQNEVLRIQNRFPNVQYLTLCVRASNEHMIPVYKGLGFKEIDFSSSGIHEEPFHYLGKKIDPNSNVEPPSYAEYKAALEAQRKS